MTILSPTCVFEVRTSGDDTNGGGFDNGVASPGTDYSQQNSAQVTYTDLVIDSFDNTKITSAAHPFTSAAPGNLINISGGSGFTAGVYLIESVSGSTAKLDQPVGATGSTGGTGKLGGAFATISQALSNMMIGGQVVWVKGGTYMISTTLTNPTVNNNTYFSIGRIVGYSSTRGDGGRPTIRPVANSGITLFAPDTGVEYTSVLSWENIEFEGNTGCPYAVGQTSAEASLQFVNCIFTNWETNAVFYLNEYWGTLTFLNCEFSSNTMQGDKGVIYFRGGIGTNGILNVSGCYFTHNSSAYTYTTAQITVTTGSSANISRCIIYDNDGVNMSGILLDDTSVANIQNNTIASNQCAGITLVTDSVGPNLIITNNIICGSPVGITGAFANTPTIVGINHNAYWSNTTDKSGFVAGDGEVSLTGSPFVNEGTDFGLNSTAGAGLACQGAGTPGPIGLTSVVGTGSLDIGALQHSTSGMALGYAYTFVS